MCFCICEREILNEFALNYLANITLPKSFANNLGNVFVPNGTSVSVFGMNVLKNETSVA